MLHALAPPPAHTPLIDDTPSAHDLELVTAVGQGLAFVSRPYAAIGKEIGMSEGEVIARLRRMLAAGIIKRLGVVVRHHELGYRANAMAVWDVADEQVGALGHRIARLDFVRLCYRRVRRAPHWPYNLFCMVHGKDRATVTQHVAEIIEAAGMQGMAHALLFSKRRFKQCGARYGSRPRAIKLAGLGTRYS